MHAESYLFKTKLDLIAVMNLHCSGYSFYERCVQITNATESYKEISPWIFEVLTGKCREWTAERVTIMPWERYGLVGFDWKLPKTLAPILGPSNLIFTQETLEEKDIEAESDIHNTNHKITEESHEEPTFYNFTRINGTTLKQKQLDSFHFLWEISLVLEI